MPSKRVTKAKEPLTRALLMQMLEFEQLPKEERPDEAWHELLDEQIELQGEHMVQILTLALCSFERFVPPISVQATERGLEIVVGYPSAAALTEGQEYPER